MRVCVWSCLLVPAVLFGAAGVPADIGDPAPDADLDGFSTECELLLGTDPEDPASHPTLADNQWKIRTYWPLIENAVEWSGSGLDGEARNGAFFEGGALILDGIDDYLSLGNDTFYNFRDRFSIGLWLKPTGKWGTGRIIGKYGNDNQRQYAVFKQGPDQLWIFLSDDGSNQEGHTVLKASGKKILQRDQWQYLAITSDLNNEPTRLRAYLNGEELALGAVTDSEITELFSGAAELTLGAYDVQAQSNNGKNGKGKDKVQHAFRGEMCRLMLSDAVLTDLEIRELHYLGAEGDLLAYLNTDYDADGLPDWWEREYLGNVASGAEDDNDEDTATNIEEYQQNLDPDSFDTDGDGFDDSFDAETSRVYFDGSEDHTQGDEYVYPAPAWLVGIWKEGGTWASWYVGPEVPAGEAALFIALDREMLTENLVMDMTYIDHAGSSLYADLLAEDLTEVALDLFGNLLTGTGVELTGSWDIPLEDYPEAAIIRIRRGEGEITINELTLYVDQDHDGLDAGQEALLETSDYSSDSDGDSLPDWDEFFEHGTDPAVDDGTVDNDGDGISNLEEILRGTDIDDDQDVYVTIYVNSITGDDSNNGYSFGSPKKTIGAAIAVALDGDTIEIAGGTYPEMPAVYDLTDKNITMIPQGSIVVE